MIISTTIVCKNLVWNFPTLVCVCLRLCPLLYSRGSFLVPRRHSLVKRDALCVMGLIVRGSQVVVCFRTINPRAPCFPAIPPSTEHFQSFYCNVRPGLHVPTLSYNICWSGNVIAFSTRVFPTVFRWTNVWEHIKHSSNKKCRTNMGAKRCDNADVV